MQISNNYFKPLKSIISCNFDEIKCNATNVFLIATYFSLIVPAIFLLASCLNGRVKPIPDDTQSPRDKELSKKILEDNAIEPKKDSEAVDLFEQGLKLHKEKNRKDAFPLFMKAAEKGHVEANYYLGKYHQYGIGNKKSYLLHPDPAIPFYKKAADQGHAKSQYRLGAIHFMRQQKNEALKYYITAAESKNKKAQYSLGGIYQTTDPQKALSFLYASAEQNYHNALHTLGTVYKRGEIVQKDPKKAIEYYQKAMDQGSVFAAGDLAYIYLNGEDVEQDLEKAMDCYLKSTRSGSFEYKIREKFLKKALNGDVQALYRLGQIHHLFMYQSIIKAVIYYKKAADENHVLAKEELDKLIYPLNNEVSAFDHLVSGAAYELGANVVKNIDKAIEQYKLAAEKKNGEAMLHLAKMYHHGKDVQQNIDEAIKYYIAYAGDFYEPKILYTIAELYEYEKKDLETAIPYYIYAAHNWPKAKVKLASLYATGNHFQKDLKKAQEYLSEAERYAGSILHDPYALACFYMSETDLKDLAKANNFMACAAAQGYEQAIYDM